MQAKAIRAVMVDVDGVLISGRPEDGLHWQTFMERDLGLSSSALHEHFFSAHWDNIVVGQASLLEHLEPALQAVAPHVSAKEFVAYWFRQDSRLNTALLQELSMLRNADIRIYLATNQEHLRAAHLMNDMGLSQHVDGIFYSAQLGAKKPDAEFFTKVQAALQLPPETLLLIDDSPQNIRAAEVAGWHTHHWTADTSPDTVRKLCLLSV